MTPHPAGDLGQGRGALAAPAPDTGTGTVTSSRTRLAATKARTTGSCPGTRTTR